MIDLNNRGHIRQRESQSLEFKEAFSLGNALLDYLKTLVGMANNGGGQIVFGVSDNPRLPVGLRDDRFASLDPRSLNRLVLEYFSSDIDWATSIIAVDNVDLGVLEVKQSNIRPVICTRNHNGKGLREGAIYYRYRGETREIKSAELAALLQYERDKERRMWMEHIKSIGTIGPQAAHILDLKNKHIDFGNAKVVVDESLIGKMKLIKEGEFFEREGAPALRLLGDIDGVVGEEGIVINEASYPYTETTILENVTIGQHTLRALVWYLEIKGDPEFHMEIRTGRTGVVHKYSNAFLGRIREIIRSEPAVLNEAVAAYRARRR